MATILRRIVNWFRPEPQQPARPLLADIIEPAIEVAGGLRKLADKIEVSRTVIFYARRHQWHRLSDQMYNKVLEGCRRLLAERNVLKEVSTVLNDVRGVIDLKGKHALIREHLDDVAEDLMILKNRIAPGPTSVRWIQDEFDGIIGRIQSFKEEHLPAAGIKSK